MKEKTKMAYLNAKITAMDDVERPDIAVDRGRGITVTQYGKSPYRAWISTTEKICKFKGRSQTMRNSKKVWEKIVLNHD